MGRLRGREEREFDFDGVEVKREKGEQSTSYFGTGRDEKAGGSVGD